MRQPGFYWVEQTCVKPFIARWDLYGGPNGWSYEGYRRLTDDTFLHIDERRIPNTEQLEKLWAVAHAAFEQRQAIPGSTVKLLAALESLAALGPLPEEKKA